MLTSFQPRYVSDSYQQVEVVRGGVMIISNKRVLYIVENALKWESPFARIVGIQLYETSLLIGLKNPSELHEIFPSAASPAEAKVQLRTICFNLIDCFKIFKKVVK
jgi:hypothetical protein